MQHLFADLLVAKIRKQESYCGKGPEFMIETENKLVSLEATLVQNSAQRLLLTGVRCGATSEAKNENFSCTTVLFLDLLAMMRRMLWIY